ncbi:MAG: DUF1700 domain-containing protein [Chitinophagaceae bacterium]|nr:DUF1700 domain-containing protein [Oligoflexus sp.]
MTEHDYLNELDSALTALPKAQRDDILDDYRSHFYEARERGKSDDEITHALGSPKVIARTFVADYHFNSWQSPVDGQSLGSRFFHLSRGLLVLLSLLFFNFFFILWPVVAGAMMLFAAWVVIAVTGLISVIFAVIGLVGGVSGLVLPNLSAQFSLFFYAVGTGLLAAMTGYALYQLSQLAIRGILRYIKLNIKLIAA